MRFQPFFFVLPTDPRKSASRSSEKLKINYVWPNPYFKCFGIFKYLKLFCKITLVVLGYHFVVGYSLGNFFYGNNHFYLARNDFFTYSETLTIKLDRMQNRRLGRTAAYWIGQGPVHFCLDQTTPLNVVHHNTIVSSILQQSSSL